tara:strand:- start:438 stop:1130 length:693 start_codon:yes stop_codon:yes gene_type:complete
MTKKHFADFWNQITSHKGAKSRANSVLKRIRKYSPNAKSVLELGVGNGLVLSLFPKKYSLSGLDVEKKFVDLSKKRMPRAHLFTASMHNFKIKKNFDVVFSVYDSINFLENINQWKQTFESVYNHLNEKGLFIFDMFLPVILEKAKEWVKFSEEPFGYMIDTGIVKGNKLTWDFKIFEKKKKLYEMHQFLFHERIFLVEDIKKSLNKYFEILESKKIDDDLRILFICRRK